MKKLSRILSVLIAAIMLLAMLPAGVIVSAEIVKSGECGDNLMWELDSDGNLTITGTGDMWDYDTGIVTASPWGKAVRTVNIADGVTSIGKYAFYECGDLTIVSIADSVSEIRQGAFCRCAGLIRINVPVNLTSIGSFAFSCCAGLESMTIPDSVTSVGKGAFELCAAGFFLVVCRDSAAHRYAIDENITFKLEGENTKYGACGDDLTWELDDEGNLTITGTGDMWAYYNELSSGRKTPWGAAPKRVTIRDGVTSIGADAFYYCADLASVTIPDSVTKISVFAFKGCEKLESVTIPDSVEYIGQEAFGYCKGLKSVALSEGLTMIDSEAFRGCNSLESVTIPAGVGFIGNGAFRDCAALESVNMLGGVTSIGEEAFEACEHLTLKVYKDSAAHLYAIENNIPFELIELTKGDPDGDGEITVSDALSALRVAAKLAEPTPVLLACCDIDGDGEITVSDALAILRIAAGLA